MTLGFLAAMLPAAVVGFFVFPLAFAAYALALAGMSAAAKVLLVGKVLPGVHRYTCFMIAVNDSSKREALYKNVLLSNGFVVTKGPISMNACIL